MFVAYADSGWVMDVPTYYDMQYSRDSIQDLYKYTNLFILFLIFILLFLFFLYFNFIIQ